VSWLGAGVRIGGKILTKVVGVDPDALRDAIIADIVAAGGSPEFPRDSIGVQPLSPRQFSQECSHFGATEAEVIECVEETGHFYFHCFGKHPSSIIGLRRSRDLPKKHMRVKHV
jgi:hypothetical protein